MRFSEAAEAYGRALEAEPRNFDAAYGFSVLRASQGDRAAALSLAHRAAAIRPGAWEAHAQAGALLLALSRPSEALSSLGRALELNPARAELHNNLGAALRALDRLVDAEACFRTAVELDPAYLDAVLNMAKILWKTQRTAEAVPYLERAIELDPGRSGVWIDLGLVCTELGDLARAERAFVRALALDPECSAIYRHLLDANPAAVLPEHRSRLEAMAKRPDLPLEEQAQLHFALGRILEAAGEMRGSFEHYVAANRAHRSQVTYDEAATIGPFETIPAVFTKGFLRSHARAGTASARSIFVFGMPRSGTTLTEQILAGHPAVYAAGEITEFGASVDEILAGEDTSVTPEAMLSADDATLHAIGERYLAALRAIAGDDYLRVTDKMPMNFKYAGLIWLALPNARMIHVVRDPVETCFSCFAQHFGADELAWAYDLRELARYYRGYRRVMEHWRAVLPADAILDVRYEDVVEDLEGQARRIVAYCGLPWDDRCLRFYDVQRAVQTASAAQVRRTLYRSSLGRAHAYGTAMQPLLDALRISDR